MYFQTPQLEDGIHKIYIVVTAATEANQFAIDYSFITPSPDNHPVSETPSSAPPSSSSSVESSRSISSSTSTPSGSPTICMTARSTNAEVIIDGVVSAIFCAVILVLALWCFLMKRYRSGRPYYFEKSTPTDILASEGP